MRGSLRDVYSYGVPVAAALLLLCAGLFFAQSCQGQSLHASGHARISAWHAPSHCYQHRMDAGGQVRAEWGPVFVRGHLRMRRWGNCNSIIESAMLNAESARAYSRWQGGLAGLMIGPVELGVQYDRRSVQHVWYDEPGWRHDYFPHDGDWRAARERCRKEENAEKVIGRADGTCPGISYWDGLRPHLAYDRGAFRIAVKGPLYHWKNLTLPWPAVRAKARYRASPWTVRAKAQGGRHRAWRGTLRLTRALTGLPDGIPGDLDIPRLHLGVAVGRAALPEHRDRVADRVALTLSWR